MKRLAPYLVCLALYAAFQAENKAAQVYWDINGPVVGAGGEAIPDGIWSASDSNWNSVSDGTGATAAWTAGDLATFAAGIGATGMYNVVVLGNQTVSGISLEEGSLTLSGGTLTSSATPLAIAASAGTRLTIHSILAGTTGLNISGGGTVRIMAPVNSFTGNITVDGTTLAYISSNSTDILAFGSGAKSITLTNGAVLAPMNSTNPGTGTKSVVIGTGGARFHVMNGVSISLDDTNQFSGTGNLTVTGSGTGLVVLRNSGTYTGSVSVQSGTLRVSSTAALGAVGGGKTISIGDGATLDIIIANFNAIPISVQGAGVNNLGAITNSSTAAGSTAAAITLLGNTSIGVNNTGALTLSGVISGDGMSLVKVGTGTGSLVLTGANTYTGDTVVNAGTLVASAATTQTPIQSSSGLVMTGTGSFQYLGRSGNSVIMTLNGLSLLGGSATVDVSNNSGTSTLLDLRGTSELLGISRIVNGGTVDFRASSGSFGDDAIVRTAQANDASGILGAWATVGNGAGFATNDGTGRIVAFGSYTDITTTGAPILDGPLSNVRLSAGIGATVGLDGSSITTIHTLAHNVSSAVTIDNANKTLRLGQTGGILMTLDAGATGALTIGATANSGILTAGGADNTDGELIVSNFSQSALTLNSVVVDNGTGVVSLTRSGTGSGAVRLAGTNTYTGVTTLNSGVTNVAVLSNINTASSIGRGSVAGSAADLVLNGGTLQYNGAAAASTDRLFSVGLGGGTLDSSSGTATATVSFTSTGAIGFNGQAGARNLTLTGTNTGANLLAAVLGDNGGSTTLTKTGAGLWVLTGDNTYTGITTITAGTLRVGNGGTTGSLGSGAVNLAGTLVFNRSDNYTVNNSIFGSSGSTINQASANVLSLAGVGINTGGFRITVDGGTIDIMGNDVILTGTSALVVSNSGTIAATGGGRILLGASNADYGAANGKTLVVNAVIADGVATTIDFHGATNGTGVTVLTGDNIFTGSANIQGQAVSVSKIGNAGTAGNLGLNAIINLGTTTQTTSRLLYTGTGESTNRAINLSSTTGAAIIDQSGSGVLEFTGDFTAVAGSKFLTLQGSTNGSGRIAGAIVDGAGNVGIVKSGTGLWTLAGNNIYTGTTTVNSGVLVAGSTSAFGINSAVTVNANGVLRLGGFSNAVASITGTGILENGGIANAVLTTGGDGSTTTFSGIVRDGGTGTLGINKSGAGVVTLAGSNLSYTGTTSVSAGTLIVTGGQASFATKGINVAGGASLLLLNQQGQSLDLGSGPLNLGAGSGITTLGFELGSNTATSDGFHTSGAAVVANQVVLSLLGIQGFGSSSFYDVLTAGSGLNTATYSLSTYVPGGYTYGLDVSSTRVRVNLTTMAAGSLYWKGGVVGGAVNSWSALVGGQSNWTTDAAGAVNANGTPGAQHSVIFSAANAVGPAITTTLDSHVSIQDLTFTASPNGVNSVTVASGSLPIIYTLTITPANAANGINVQDNAGNVFITAPVMLGASQTWQVAGTGANGSSLAVTGGVSGNAGLTKTGAGVLSLGTATYSGDTVISAGTVVAGAANSFSAASAHTVNAAAILRLNGFAANVGSLAGAGTVENNHASIASVLTVGGNNQSTTFSGILRNGNTGTLGLTKTGTGLFTLTGVNTYTGPTVVSGGTLRMGSGGSLTGAGALSVLAEAGATAAFDLNGAVLTFSSITLGGASSTSSAAILDTAGTGVITLTGNITYGATGNPQGAVVNAAIAYNAGSRTITATSSLGADVELAFNNTITATGFTTDQRIIFAGTGDITLNGATSVAGSGSDLQKNGTGILNINAATTAADDWVIDAGITNANVSNALNATDDIVIDGTGVQDSAVVNIGGSAGTSGVHQGDDIFIRNGGRINVTVNNGISTGTDYLLVGDSASASVAAAGRLHLAADISVGTTGLQVGGSGGNTGNITGNGSITTAGTFSLRNGSVAAGISFAGAGSITKVTNGTLVFSGTSTASGTTNVQEGILVLDYTENNGSKIGAALALGATQPNLSGGGATLIINGSSSSATLQSVTSTSILLGSTTVEINAGAGQTAALALGAITRAAGAGTVDFVYGDNSAFATTSSINTVLGYATVKTGNGSTRLAASDGSGRIGQADTVVKQNQSLWTRGDNVITAGGFTGSVGSTSRAVSSLTFAATAAATVSVADGRQFTISSGGILVDADVGNNMSLITGGQIGGSTTGLANELVVHQYNTTGALEVASRLFNLVNLSKSGAGTLILSGNNIFSSSISNATASASVLALNEGTVILRGGDALGDTLSVHMKQGTALVLEAGTTETIGRLGVDGTSISAGTIRLGAGSVLTINQTGSSAFAGVLEGSGTLNKSGAGNLQLTGSTTGFTGVVNVNMGLLYISGSGGRLNGVTEFNLNAGSSLLIDNDDDASNTTRLSDSSVFTLNSANGSWTSETRPRGLSIRTDNNNNSNTETLGSIVLASGANYASLEASGGTSSVAGIIAATGISRSAGTTFNIRGAGLGAASGQRTFLKIADANDSAFMAANLVGGGAAAGSSLKNVSIVPWAIGESIVGDIADANMGNSLVTYVDNRGFVALDLATEYRTFSAGGTVQDNIREVLTANLTGVSGQTINALVVHDNTTASGSLTFAGTGTLVNTSGAFLFTVNAAATASTAHNLTVNGFSDIQVGATNEYVMQVVNPSSVATAPTLSVEIVSNLTSMGASLLKSGRGTLVLSGANTYGGGTYLNEGALQISSLSNLGTGGLVFNGGILRLAGGFAADLSSRAISVSAAGGSLDTNGAAYVWTNGMDMAGTGPFAKIGSGLMTVQGASSFTGTLIAGHAVGATGATIGVTDGVLLNGTTNQAVAGDLQIGSTTVPAAGVAGVALGANEQIVDTTVIRFNGSTTTNRFAYFKLLGHSETVAGISDTTGSGIIENIDSDVVSSAGTLTLGGSGQYSYNGVIRDNAAGTADVNPLALVKQGLGTQILSGAGIRYTGGTTVNGGILYLHNTSSFSGPITNNAELIFDYTSGTALALADAVGGSGRLTKRGTGTVRLNGNNTFSGGLVVEDGTLAFDQNLGADVVGNSVTLLEGSILQSTGLNTVVGVNQSFSLGAGTMTMDAAAGSTSSMSILGAVTSLSDTALVKVGSGRLILGNATGFTGQFQVNTGTLELRSSTNASKAVAANGSSIAFNTSALGSGAVHTLAGSGSVLELGTAGGFASLGFGINGATNDKLMLSAGQSISVGGIGVGVDIYFTGTPTLLSYNLIESVDNASYSSFSLGTIFNPGSYLYTLDTSGSHNLVLNLQALAGPATAYWKGDLGGSGTGVWSAAEVGGNTNWATAADGLTDTQVVPDSGTNVFFNASGAANFTTTLGADISVRGITFLAGSGAGGSGTVIAGGNTLTLGAGGITLVSGAGSTSISPDIVLASNQTWEVTDSGTLLTINGSLSGPGDLIKTGSGTLILNASNTHLGFTIINEGVLQVGTGGATGDLGPGAVVNNASLSVNRSGTLTLAQIIAGTGSLTKLGSGTLVLSGNNTYSGSTFVGEGTLAFGANQNLTAATNHLILGATPGTSQVVSLDLNAASAVFGGGFTVQTNTTTANTVAIGAGHTLQINGAVVIGVNTGGTTDTSLTVSGGGTFSIGSATQATNNGFLMGANTTTQMSNGVTLDMSGLTTFYANLGSGTFRVGDATNAGGNATKGSTLILAQDSTIRATTIALDSPDGNVTETLRLGSGTNVLHANTISIGASGGSTRSGGLLNFRTTTGTLEVRNLAGSGRATLNVAYGGPTTGFAYSSTVDLRGHSVDLLLGTLGIGGRTATSGAGATGTFQFDTGVMDVTSVIVGARASTAAGISTGTLQLSGGTVTIGAGGVSLANNTATGATASNAVATMTVDGTASVTIGATAGTSIILGNSVTTGRLSTATLTIGGTSSVTLAGDLVEGTGAGNASVTSTLTLNGGTLDMGGNDIGTAGQTVNVLNFQSGRLRNVASINGTAGLTKTTAGTLIVSGINTYTGASTVQAGVLQVGEAHAGSITSATTVQAGATLAGTGTVSNQVNVLNDSFLKPGDAGGAGKGRLTVGTLSVAQGGQIQIQLSAATVPQSGSIVSAITGPGWVDAQTYFTSNAPAWEVAASPLTSHDAITVNGTLTLGTREAGAYGNGTILLVNDGYISALGDVFNLLDWVGMIQGGFNVTSGIFAGSTSVGDLDLPALQAGHSWDTSAFMSQGILVVVPEPSRVLLLLFAAASVTLGRRRSK